MYKLIFSNLILSILLFTFTDFVYSKFIFDKEKKIKTVYEFNEKYHHFLKKNYSDISQYGYKKPHICTNEFRLKVDCKNINNSKNYDIGILGDSFVEGVGLEYNKTFVGILDLKENLSIANLGTGSYSPLLYFEKLKLLINYGFKFKEIIVFVDISDIQDEINYYKLDGNIKNKIYDEQNSYTNQEKNNYTNGSFSLKNFIFSNFKMSFYLISNLKRIFIIADPFNIYNKNDGRWSWTFNKSIKNFSEEEINEGISKAKKNLENIFLFLKDRNIDFSIAVYPTPHQILYDKEDNRQNKIWKKFCEFKCKKYYDFNKIFFKKKENMQLKKFIKKYYFVYDEHFNFNGNKLIAEEFIKIRKNK